MSGGGGDNKVVATEAEKRVSALAAKRWNRYQQYGVPAEDRFIDKAQMKGKDFDQASGYANVDANAAFGQQPQVQTGGQRGGNIATSIAEEGLDKGSSLSRNLTMSGIQTDDRHAEGKMAIVSAGMGKGVSALRGATNVAATNLNSSINDAYRSRQRRQSNLDSGFGVVGMGARAAMEPARGDPSGADRPYYESGRRQEGPFNENLDF